MSPAAVGEPPPHAPAVRTLPSRAQPSHPTALLLLEDGTAIWGEGFGAQARRFGELCFHTGMSGYQETITDPSYAGEIIVFTAPHIGNVGVNPQDYESPAPHALGLVVREPPTRHSNWRASEDLDTWLQDAGLPAIARVDTRSLTRRIRDKGAPRALLWHDAKAFAKPEFALRELLEEVRAHPGLEGADLAGEVTCSQAYKWDEHAAADAAWGTPPPRADDSRANIVALDFGIKRTILRALTARGARITVLPASATAEEILRCTPDGVFLSNGPGDPAATGQYAEQTLLSLFMQAPALPVFGICLGHQLIGRAFGLKTRKLPFGHHGANHPVLEHTTGRVAVTSQNHNFCIETETLPRGLAVGHTSLFDQTNEGLVCTDDRPVFSVQFHPEASPGPHDTAELFDRFLGSARNPRNR